MRKDWLDAHHHLWRYTPAEYDWIGPGMEAIARDFTLDECEALALEEGITGSIAVQARSTLAETDWLLAQAHLSSFIRGVVGWVPLTEPGVEGHLERLGAAGKLVGVRHILQAEPDPGYMLRDDFNAGIACLTRHRLAYDILILPPLMAAAIELVDRHPEQVFLLDHLGKPPIAAGEIAAWRTEIRRLAERPNVACKLSGMVTEADWTSWTVDGLRPYFEVVLEAFGPERLMWGSDWPVLNVAGDYKTWRGVVAAWLEPLSEEEAEAVRRGTAERVYRIGSGENKALPGDTGVSGRERKGGFFGGSGPTPTPGGLCVKNKIPGHLTPG